MIHECLNCFKQFKRPRKNAKFCSRSCSITFNNKVNPKRKTKLTKFCSCGKIKNHKSKQCLNCYKIKRDIGLITLAEVIYSNQQNSNKYAKIRSHARFKFKDIKSCQKCGYSKHIERCHIKAIKDFPLSATLNEINDRNNLLFLCPNCHWEYDYLNK